MNHKPDAAFVNAHPETFGGHKHVHLALLEIGLIVLNQFFPFFRLESVYAIKFMSAI